MGSAIGECLNHTDGEAAKSGHIRGAVAGANARTILVKVPVDNVVAAILDDPMAAIGGEDVFWGGLFGRMAGDTQRQLGRQLAGFLVQNFALDHENLPDMGKVEERV